VGSRNERLGITGASHWVEHMLFKGAREFGKGDIFKKCRASTAAVNNGMTGNDYTAYFETLPSEARRPGAAHRGRPHGHTPSSIPTRSPPNAASSSPNAKGAENYPQYLLGEEMSTAAAFRDHPYRWSVIGWKADLREITHGDLWSHYQQFYAPDNAVLVVVGDFETEAMLRRVRELYGGLAGRAQVPPIRSVEPPQEGERRFTIRRPGSAAYLQVAHHIPAAGHPDEPALRVLSSILSGTGPIAWLSPSAGGWKTSRVYRALVDTGLASSASASVTPRGIDPGLGGCHATVRVGVEPKRVEEAVLRLIGEATAAPPTADELQRAKTQLMAAMAYAGESAAGIAALVGGAEMLGGYQRVARMADEIMAVTAEDVLRVAQTHLTENNRTVGWFIPTEAGGGGDCRAGACTPPMDGGPHDMVGAQVPAPQGFFYTGLDLFRNARRETLDNGLRVVAARSAVTPSVSLAGSIRGGGTLDTDGKAGRARFAMTMLDRGTTSKSKEEIAGALDGVGATFGVGAGLEATGFGGNCLNDNLELLLDTAADVLMNPAFPPDECEKARSEILTSLRESADDTREVATRAARQLLYPAGHPYHVWERGERETIEAMTREDLVACHQAAARPDQTVLVLVGDVEPERAVALVAERFGNWRATGPAPVVYLAARPPDQTRSQNLLMPSKTQCDIVLATTGVPRAHEDFYALDFATRVLGRLGFMGRFGKTVRDELGLAYYCFAVAPESYGDAIWTAAAGVNPQNVPLAIDTMLEQMRVMQEEPVSEAEYDELVANQLGALAMLAETKGRIAGALLKLEIWELGADFYERYPDIVRGVTREQILEAARRYFPVVAQVRAVAGPAWREA
jgi:zinc protease